jgi:hypothetical protein
MLNTVTPLKSCLNYQFPLQNIRHSHFFDNVDFISQLHLQNSEQVEEFEKLIALSIFTPKY